MNPKQPSPAYSSHALPGIVPGSTSGTISLSLLITSGKPRRMVGRVLHVGCSIQELLDELPLDVLMQYRDQLAQKLRTPS
jgi:hypothetical protein